MNAKLIEDLQFWYRRIAPCEYSGLHLQAEECYRLALALECAHDDLLELQTQLDIERSALHVLDPEGSRRRVELQRAYGATPYEARTRRAGSWGAEAENPKG